MAGKIYGLECGNRLRGFRFYRRSNRRLEDRSETRGDWLVDSPTKPHANLIGCTPQRPCTTLAWPSLVLFVGLVHGSKTRFKRHADGRPLKVLEVRRFGYRTPAIEICLDAVTM